MVTPRLVRLAAIVVCIGGIAGMIVTSIADSNTGALTFGLCTLGGALALLLLGAVAPTRAAVDEVAAAELELEIGELVAAGADERRLRRVVRLARALDPPARQRTHR
jgi:hypothetical protein